MKKLLFLLAGIILSGTLMAQKPFVVFNHVPKNLFAGETADKNIRATGGFLWSLDAVVSGTMLTKGESSIETSFLSAAGAAIGYKFFEPQEDGTAVAKYGISLAILTQIKVNETVQSGLDVALLGSLYNITAGPVYLVNDKKLGVMIGATIAF